MFLPSLLWLCALSIAIVRAQQPVTVHDNKQNLTYVGYSFQTVDNFQGIRFGEDTSGFNRFRHPKPFTYPTGTVINATTAGASCPQTTIESLAGFTENPGVYNLSEDCLNLRIARPHGTEQNANLPVMVWIYGGSDEEGSANYSIFEPTALVAASANSTPIIYVAMNYRVNVFGFANSKALRNEKSLNSGLLDQRLALEWIQANIATFGGNPKNVTLFGQSDGATGAGLQMTAYGGKGTVPFNRAIMMSGSPAADPGVSGNFTIVSTNTVSQLAGCPTTNSTQQLSCLRGLQWQKLFSAVQKYENITSTKISQDIFFPTIDDFVPDAPSKLLRTGQFHRNISVMAGFTYNDGSLFTNPTINSTEAVQAFLHADYPHLNSTTLQKLIQMCPINQFTTAAKPVNISAYWEQASRIVRDINFACPALSATHHVAQYGSSSYIYELNATALTPELELAHAAYLGVIHTSDIFFVFGEATAFDGSAEIQSIQTKLMGSFIRFATTGRPSGVGDGTEEGWSPVYGPTAAKVKGEAVQQASVRVVGGVNAGQQEIMMEGQVGVGTESETLKRCAFINSAQFYEQIQT